MGRGGGERCHREKEGGECETEGVRMTGSEGMRKDRRTSIGEGGREGRR